ncbi:hypothetical protein QFC22_001377 [Naganishia vaughanmartiniae]|uniref:Uncharacterized protein n=1 Tax=Naganishia vaughanmartiniae TaxID=1424756 RepID=A0ACC2XIB7_9TREE|nr:hypothetical protein QFC22_001377 [Naganishia vaughanmartiniae]
MDIAAKRKPTTPASVASDSFGSPPGNRHIFPPTLHRSHPSSASITSSNGSGGQAVPTTQTSYVNVGSVSPPAGRAELHNAFAHGWQPQQTQQSQHPHHPHHPGMPHSQNSQRLPSFAMHPFLSGAGGPASQANHTQMSSSPPGLGSSGFPSPVLSHNVSFTSVDQALPAVRVQGLGHYPGAAASAVAAAVFPQGQRSRSRRSSVGLAVSVSLASRSRSHTPIGSPPTSPSRRLSREIGRGPQAQLDRILASVGTAGTGLGLTAKDRESKGPQNKNGKTPLGDNVFEFTDFGWDEAFEDDDDDMFDVGDGFDGNNRRLVDLVTEEAEDESRQASLDARLKAGISIGGYHRTDGLKSRTASRRSQLTQHRDDANLINSDSARPEHKNDILPLGFKFGAGLPFQGEIIENVDPVGSLKSRGKEVPGATCARFNSPRLGHASLAIGKAFEVVRKLGSGSYAMVYLVKEVGGGGQEFALKCLSKQHLEEEALDVQMFEATIHLSLPKHVNIVTLHQTLQTKKWLFLLLEMCPGEDLFYWLEHSRDSPPETIASSHEDHTPHNYHQPPLSSSNLPSSAIPYSTSAMIAGMGSMSLSQSPAFTFSKSHLSSDHHSGSSGHPGTPTTPSLLAAYSANALLSTRRLKLIASMFGQMCQAVALCHDVGVSHRDIKPENFICCDSDELAGTRDNDDQHAYDRKRVIVKLTDFGLATTNEISYDVECGSRPYMAYECRNELGPNYKPKPADVWSLGVVLLNMLFHRNPWTDPTPGNRNFEGFMEDPVEFLLTRFTGIGWEVATYLAEKVFTMDAEARVSAAEFGRWSKNLPSMIGGRKAVHNLRLTHLNGGHGNKSSLDFTKSPIEPREASSALSFKPPSAASTLTQTAPKTSSGLSAPSIIEEWQETEEFTGTETVLTPPPTEQAKPGLLPKSESDAFAAVEHAKAKRKKRGTRSKNKAAQAAAEALLTGLSDERHSPEISEKEVVLADLAEASQQLAREISSATRSSDKANVIDLDEFPKLGETEAPATIKKSRWKALIDSSNGNVELQALMKKVQDRDTGSAYRSAPAKLQHLAKKAPHDQRSSTSANSYTPSLSLASSSQLSSYNPTASLPGSSNGVESDNWRRSPLSHEKGKHEDLYRGRDSVIAGHHAKHKDKVTRHSSPLSSMAHYEPSPARNTNGSDFLGASDIRTNAPRTPRMDFKQTCHEDAQAAYLDHKTPRPLHQPLVPMAQAGQQSSSDIRPPPSATVEIPYKMKAHVDDGNSKGSHPEVFTGNVPPTKLRAQISSLGKMLSSLKTSKAKD